MPLRPLSLAVLLTSIALAGCLAPGGPAPPVGGAAAAPHLVCLDENSTRVCNFEATLDPETRQANELSVAVNPRDPLNIIATGKDYTPEYAGDCVWDGIYTTLDGGRTWKNQNVPGSPWKRLQDPSEPLTSVSNFWCATDPIVAFGPDGTAYWAVMPYQCDPASGSKTGRELVPGSGVGIPATPLGGGGGLNDWFWTCSSMYVLVSDDGGTTWPADRMRRVAFGPRLEHDKAWLSVAPNGNVLLCWDRGSDADVGLVPPPDPRLPHNAVVCSVSLDKGGSWSDLADMATGIAFPWVDYGSDNTAYASAILADGVGVLKSADGLTWSPPVTVGPSTNPPPNAEYGWPGLNGSKFRVFTNPVLAVDRSNGTFGGSIYMLWMTWNGDDADVLLSFSRDAGASWSPAAKVHDDDPARHVDQFMPAMSVGPDGTVDISWYDRRWDPANHLIDLAYTYSVDGGRSFAPNLRVTEGSFDEQYSHHQNGAIFLGDYRDSDSSPGQAHVVWTDTRHQIADVFLATIERPGANPAP